MKDERKKSEEQFYLSKTKPELINISEEPDMTSENIADDATRSEERSSLLKQRNPEENDISKHAHRIAVNYARSLLLF